MTPPDAPATSAPGPEVTLRYAVQGSTLIVRRAYCKACNLCLDACPARILTLDALDRIDVTDIARCTFCGLCAARCPDFVFVLDASAPHAHASMPFRLTAAQGGA